MKDRERTIKMIVAYMCKHSVYSRETELVSKVERALARVSDDGLEAMHKLFVLGAVGDRDRAKR